MNTLTSHQPTFPAKQASSPSLHLKSQYAFGLTYPTGAGEIVPPAKNFPYTLKSGFSFGLPFQPLTGHPLGLGVLAQQVHYLAVVRHWGLRLRSITLSLSRPSTNPYG